MKHNLLSQIRQVLVFSVTMTFGLVALMAGIQFHDPIRGVLGALLVINGINALVEERLHHAPAKEPQA